MFELAKEPANIGRVIDGGIKLFTGSIKSVFLLALAATFIIYVPELLIRIITLLPVTSENITMGVLSIFLFLLMTILYITFYSALILKVWACARQETVELKQLIDKGFAVLVPVFLASVVYGIVVMIGMLLLILPGIYICVALSLYYYVIVIENLGPIEGLKRSFRLIKGHWWRTFLILFIPTMIFMLVFTVVGFVAVISAFVLTGFSEEGLMFEIIMDIFNNLTQAVAVPFFISLMLVFYNDLKLRLEGSAEKAEQLENPVVQS